uniref:Spermidine/putrescine import ATP-binding protein PotA n=1 Tax=uncultured bacterium pBIO2079 TaxID=1478040 RepID=A0A075FBM7_9BACT|nr:spermidine/putrescine import ATP-binding protein PotA [uncultured bacterium pBIO2079]
MAILGPSGCGKTMTLKCIAGLMTPDQGKIVLNEQVLFDSQQRINLPTRERKIGFLFQNYALFPHLTVHENIAFGIRQLPVAQRNERVQQLLGKMRLDRFGHRYPVELSGGQQQRVALARALAPEPQVLLLDEPFSALDTQVKERLEAELLEIQSDFQGHVLFVTHNLAEAYRLSSKMAVYETGGLLQWGERHTIIEHPANKTVARLTGMENIFDGMVSGIEGSRVDIRMGAGHLSLYPDNPSSLEVNQEISVAIRPEYVKLADNHDGNCLAVELVDSTEELTFYSYTFKIMEQVNMKAYIPKSTSPRLVLGKTYYLYLPPENLVIIGL